jgi:Ca2+-binding RTX toxin-like protein
MRGLVTVAATVCLWAAGDARAAVYVVSHDGIDAIESIRYSAQAGEANRVRVTYDGARVRIEDPGIRIVESDGGDVVGEVRCLAAGSEPAPWECRFLPTLACVSDGNNYVDCAAPGLREIVVDLGDGDDRFAAAVARGPSLHVAGAGGADVLNGNEIGGAVAVLDGGEGDDALRGSGGPSHLAGGPGADVFSGGAGHETVDYRASLLPVTVTLDGSAGDGAPLEGDDVGAGVDAVIGSAFRDELVGSDGGETLDGAGGDDRVNGRGGFDRVLGGAGADWLFGGYGRDTVSGGDGPDTIRVADDAADVFDCGLGVDQLERDALDTGDAARCELAYGALR